MWFNRNRSPYSQEEITEQIGQVGDLMRQRKSSQLTDEIERFNVAVETAQQVLNFMLDEVRDWQGKHVRTRRTQSQ